MKVLTFSTKFPAGHPKTGRNTHFVEKIWNAFRGEDYALPIHFRQWTNSFPFIGDEYLKGTHRASTRDCKFHTIRAGSRFKPGDMVSLRVWSGAPYRSKQIEFAQVEVKKVWSIEINAYWWINYNIIEHDEVIELAKNDGLSYEDFIAWFAIHPKKQDQVFTGQIICWNDSIEYSKPLLAEKIK